MDQRAKKEVGDAKMENSYEVRGDVTAIFVNSPTHGNFEVLIDTDSLGVANKHTWGVGKNNRIYGPKFYPMSTVTKNGKKSVVYLARLILGLTSKEEVLYADHNPLNLKKDNISAANKYARHDNRVNKRKVISGVRGVHWCEQTKKWRAVVVVNKKYKNIGRYNTIKEAESAILKVRSEIEEARNN